jgi:DNA helicase-2/ATP-dependent DNA helicase PcrA
MQLNASQKAAVESSNENIMVVAGPGSGKTRTLIERIRNLSQGFNPERFVVITFTNAAAQEMASRLAEYKIKVGYIGTLHGFCLKLLQIPELASKTGYTTKVTVITEDQADDILDQMRLKMNSRTPLKKIKELKRKGKLGKDANSLVIHQYYRELRYNNAVDFDQILVRGLEVIKQCSGILEDRYTHLFVDEYQDSGSIDNDIYDHFPCYAKFFCGDTDQAIYGFRGGDMESMIERSKAIEGSGGEIFYLDENYRCGAAVCQAANMLIRNNKNRIHKETKPIEKNGGKVLSTSHPNHLKELIWLAEQLKDAGDETAVLCRTNRLVNAAAKFLSDAGIAVKSAKREKPPEDWRLAMATLELISNPYNQMVCRSWLKERFGEDGAAEIIQKAKKEEKTITDYYFSDEKIKAMEEVDLQSLPDLLIGFLGDGESFQKINQIAQEMPGLELNTIIYELYNSMFESKETGHGVTIATFHSAKGREWRNVYLIGLEDEIIPRSNATPESIEEERRILFVAITRAEEYLHLSHAAIRPAPWGNHQEIECKPSRFLSETLASS